MAKNTWQWIQRQIPWQKLHKSPDKMSFWFVKVISVPFKSTFVIKMITPEILANCAKRHLTIIPRARMGSESIAHEADARMGY